MSTESEPENEDGRAAAHDATSAPGRALNALEDQFALRQLIGEYLVPVETNTIWYALGGVLGIAIILEIVTGCVMALRYVPEAGRAYFDTYDMIHSPLWHVLIDFHYFNSFLIFGLVMVHLMRVFISGGYRRGKQGLWLVGVALAGLTFIAVLTGESLHWDEVGFGVPWNVSEVFAAFHLADRISYTSEDVLSIGGATARLVQIYILHVAIVPILILLAMLTHYYLIRVKGISLPFWHRASGRKTPFTEHMRSWFTYGTVLLGGVLLLAIFVNRGAGTQPQLLPSSPFYGIDDDPGGLGYKPSFPISWTRGMNIFFADHLHITPDIWGSIVGMALMLLLLVAIPFIDSGKREPQDVREAFNWRRRGLAFLAIAMFWTIMIVGIVQSAMTGAG
jgi:quinol-cytochrome oxidoreductase complex cytochrome b subunit